MNEADFAGIIKETKGVVLSAIKKNLAGHYAHAVDDVAQETYVRAYNALASGKFRNDSALSTWLYTIARNEALRMNARLKREERKNENSWIFGLFQTGNNPVKEKDLESDVSELRKHISSLSLRYRSIMALYCDGFSDAEISEKLELPVGTIKSSKHRATEELRVLMLKGGEQHA